MDNILNKKINIKSKRIASYKKTDGSGYLFLPYIAASISQNYVDANVHLHSQVGKKMIYKINKL